MQFRDIRGLFTVPEQEFLMRRLSTTDKPNLVFQGASSSTANITSAPPHNLPPPPVPSPALQPLPQQSIFIPPEVLPATRTPMTTTSSIPFNVSASSTPSSISPSSN